MISTRVHRTLLACIPALSMLTACGTGADATDSASSTPSEFPTPSAVAAAGTASAAFVPTRLDELTKATPTVLVGRECGTERTETVQGAAFPVSKFCVLDVVRDQTGIVRKNDVILLRQSATYRTKAGEIAPLVTGTQPFMIFVQRFEFVSGEPTDQWTTVGVAAGVWVSTVSEARTQRSSEPLAGFVDSFQAVDPELVNTMPRTVKTGDIRK